MAKSDWDFLGYSNVGLVITKAHASLANPLAGHGTHCLQCFTAGDVFQTFGAHCMDSKTKDIAYGVDTFVEAFMRFENRANVSTRIAAYLSAADNNASPGLGSGYSICLNRNGGDSGSVDKMNLDVICVDSGTVEVHRFPGPEQLDPNVWYRVRLERRAVDAHTLRLVAKYATYPDLDDDEDFVTFLDTTVADTDAWFFGGTQPRMGFELYANYYGTNLYIDGWKGGPF